MYEQKRKGLIKEPGQWFAHNKTKVAAGVAAAFLLLSSVYTVESGTVGVLSTLGKYDPDEVQPGLHFKIPLAQKVYIFDVRLHAANYKSNKDLPDGHGVINKPAIRVLDAKNLPIGIEMTVQYTPKPTEASEILAKYGRGYFDKLINPVVRDVVRDVIGQYQAEQIAADRAKIAAEIRTKLEAKFAKLPFALNDVLLRDIKLPKVVIKKIEEVQLAKQEEQKLAMVEKQAIKRQKIKTIEANTRLIEITTKAKADAEKKKIEADAKAYQITKEAEAVARANREIAASIDDRLIRYKWIERWSGKLPDTYLGGDKGGLMLDLGKR